MEAVIEMSSRPMPANNSLLPRLPRKLVLSGSLLLVALLVMALTLFASSALAMVTEVEGHSYGVTPRSVDLAAPNAQAADDFADPHGHAVVQSSNVYVIYWDPTKYDYHGDWQHDIDGFLSNVGTQSGSLSNVFAVDSQYVDKSNHRAGYSVTFRGAYTDTDAYPTADCTAPAPFVGYGLITRTCLTDVEMQEELKSFISQHKLQTGMNAIFYMLTPPGITVCLDGGGSTGHCSDYAKSSKASYEASFCSYHNYINPDSAPEGDGSTILYAVVPWIAGNLGDGESSQENDAYPCQDGGWDPAKNGEEQEQTKPKTPQEEKIEEEAFEKMDEAEKEKEEEKKRLDLAGPHQQEPNQIGLGPDGRYDTGLADLIINQIAVEQQNVTTDPLLDGWQGEATEKVGGVTVSKSLELMDLCRNFFELTDGGAETVQENTNAGTLFNQAINGGNYYLNDTFNLAARELNYPGVPCLTGVNLVPQFTAPNTVNVNELVGFDGMESDITMDAGVSFSPTGEQTPAYSTFTWNFGDGTPSVSGAAPGAPSVDSPGVSPCAAPWEAPCAASTYHSYQYGGTYEVTLTVTDVGGNTASVTEPVTVVGPQPPSSSGPGTTSKESGSVTGSVTPGPTGTVPSGTGSSGTSAAGGGSLAPSVTPAPVLTDVVESTSLKKVKSSGLAVHYTVNEQVAGSVQVLLESAVAKRLGIKGPVATGLAKGSPSSIVIGSAVLVATKAGQGTIRIKFSSKTAARLARSHKLKLMLRLLARNASRQSPQTTTVLSTVVLSG
ncbi:MAG: PKD domain-containing protein [Solirubrobacteraceae bacterium]